MDFLFANCVEQEITIRIDNVKRVARRNGGNTLWKVVENL